MDERARSVAMLGAAIVALVLAVVVLPPMMRPDRTQPQASGDSSSPSTGIGGTLAVSGDRTGTLLLDRVSSSDEFVLMGTGGRVAFTGRPATIARMTFDDLELYLDPDACTYEAGDRDADSGLAPLEVQCIDIGDVRDTAVVSFEGTLRLPAEQLGVRGDLPATGGQVALAATALEFDEASLDLRRPAVLETGPNSFVRNPPVYPVSLTAVDGSLEFEYDSINRELRLIGIERVDQRWDIEDGACVVQLRGLGDLSPRVTVVEMLLNCAAVEADGAGAATVEGALIVDITAYRP